jgi:hypothetical protein
MGLPGHFFADIIMNNNQTGSFHRSSVDQAALSRNFIVTLLFVLTITVASFVLKTGNFVFMAAVVLLPFALILMHQPKVVLVMVLVLNATMLPVPGLENSTLGLLAQIILTGTYLLGLMLGQLSWQKDKCVERKLVILYMWLLIMLIVTRGAGLRILGSATWGGTQYIQQFAAIFLFYVTSGFILPKKHIRWIIWGGLIASAIGAAISYKTGWAFSESTNEVNQGRLAFLRPLFYGLFPVAIIVSWKNIKLLNLLLVLLSFLVIALTGFRSLLVGGVMVLAGYGFFRARNKTQYSLLLIMVGLLSWGVLIAVSSSLPIGIQRSISFIPGTHVPHEVAMNATESVEWRVEIWTFCLQHAREYLLIGRGVTFNVVDVIKNTSFADLRGQTTWFMFETHSYHSGPLSLLIDLGIPGVIIHFLFTVYAIKRFWRYAVKLAKIDTFEAKFALYYCVVLLWDLVSFYVVFGSIARIALAIVNFAVASIMANSVFKMEESKALEKEVLGAIT